MLTMRTETWRSEEFIILDYFEMNMIFYDLYMIFFVSHLFAFVNGITLHTVGDEKMAEKVPTCISMYWA